MMDAYNEAVAVDVFMEDLAQSGMYRFAELETRKDPAISVEGTKMELYTILDTNELEDYVVKYYIDGRKVGETSDVPYRHSLQIGGLSDERHTLNVQVYTGKTMMAERNFTVVANDDGALIESSAYKVIHFEDIRSHWSEQYVIEVSKRGLVVGSNGVFRPDDLISRAEMTSVITKLGKLPTGGTVSFTDVGAGKWYHQYVGNASKYLVGYGSKYYPERNATREEIITAIVKMKGYNVSNITQKDRDDFNKKFWDHYQISPENKDYMILAVKYDIIGGYAEGTLKPKNNMKRGEVAKVLYTTFYQ